ncbi:hypothetical protein [Pseudaquabacterium rugosum]|jgi:hypothetical protein|uniref:Uncharacterized protein n=1 Tax=Pseudaquabacterium rugosum TaxID=2984194 RepID=A0ABU9BDU1_9BURK
MTPMPQTFVHPFAMMLDPQAVMARVESSERLDRLQRRVCRPLDRPLLARRDGSPLARQTVIDDSSDDDLDVAADQDGQGA